MLAPVWVIAAHEQGFDESLLMASGLYRPEDHPDVVTAKLDFDPIDQFLWSALTYVNLLLPLPLDFSA